MQYDFQIMPTAIRVHSLTLSGLGPKTLPAMEAHGKRQGQTSQDTGLRAAFDTHVEGARMTRGLKKRTGPACYTGPALKPSCRVPLARVRQGNIGRTPMQRRAQNFTKASKTQADGQMTFPLEHVPPKVRVHGLADAHVRPLVSKGKQREDAFLGSFRVDPAVAWTFPSLEYARTGNSQAAIVLDLDGADAAERLIEALIVGHVPEPNWTVLRTASGGLHVAWTLAHPVHNGDAARVAPIRTLARVSERFAEVLEADAGYSGVLSHNPMSAAQRGTGLRTTWGRREPYDVGGELIGFVPKHWRRPKRSLTAVGRNCELFLAMCRWAGSPHNLGCDVLPVALEANRGWFDVPLDDGEVQGIAWSVERYRRRWIAQGRFIDVSLEAVSERQATRGRASGKARRKVLAERDAAIVEDRASGMTERAIAAKHGISKTAVHHVLRRMAPLGL